MYIYFLYCKWKCPQNCNIFLARMFLKFNFSSEKIKQQSHYHKWHLGNNQIQNTINNKQYKCFISIFLFLIQNEANSLWMNITILEVAGGTFSEFVLLHIKPLPIALCDYKLRTKKHSNLSKESQELHRVHRPIHMRFYLKGAAGGDTRFY